MTVASIRTAFAERFGEDQAQAIWDAAEGHGNGVNDANRGADPFKWALLMVIGYECASKDRYRDHHGITAPWPDVREWMIAHADLGSHDGDADYMAAFCGAYDDFVKPPVGAA